MGKWKRIVWSWSKDRHCRQGGARIGPVGLGLEGQGAAGRARPDWAGSAREQHGAAGKAGHDPARRGSARRSATRRSRNGNMKSKTDIKQILDDIARCNRGLLTPEAVVAFARPKSSPLHSRFTWDDTIAASQYRLWEARQLIRVTATLIGGDDVNPIRAFVSLVPDRDRKAGGYRGIAAVLSDPTMREQMLADALAEMEVFEEKYRALSELASIFQAARKIRSKRKKAR